MISVTITVIVVLLLIAVVGAISRGIVRWLQWPDFVWHVVTVLFALVAFAYVLGGGERIPLPR